MKTEYHKIQSIYKRDQKGKFIDGQWSRPEIGYLASLEWEWTEKVDGTNIRLILEDGVFTIGGRTERAQLPAKLVDYIHQSGIEQRMRDHFQDAEGPVVLYGEGFGAKIQKGGGNYGAEQRFVLFDVRVGRWWLTRGAVNEIAEKVGVPVVPVVGTGSIYEAIEFVRAGMKSTWGDFIAEGVVCRPVVHMKSRSGERIIVKVKGKDLIRMNE